MRKQQFGRPRAAIVIGAVCIPIGIAALFIDGVGGRTGLPIPFFGAILIICGIAFIALAIRQIRSER